MASSILYPRKTPGGGEKRGEGGDYSGTGEGGKGRRREEPEGEDEKGGGRDQPKVKK